MMSAWETVSNLQELNLDNCKALVELPSGLEQLSSLMNTHISYVNTILNNIAGTLQNCNF